MLYYQYKDALEIKDNDKVSSTFLCQPQIENIFFLKHSQAEFCFKNYGDWGLESIFL